MKQEIHPVYREVIFRDIASNASFLIRSTIQTSNTEKWEDGKEYPFVKVEISSESHPFYTGKQRLIDAEGRVERFRKRYQKGKK